MKKQKNNIEDSMKEYIKPIVEVYETHVEEMICLSGGGSQPDVNAEAPERLFDETEEINLW